MLNYYLNEFESIQRITDDNKRTALLANLMTQMENKYSLSMNRERFERETTPAVKELYKAISNARNI